MAATGPGGNGNCPVYGTEGHQYFSADDDYLECACGDEIFRDSND